MRHVNIINFFQTEKTYSREHVLAHIAAAVYPTVCTTTGYAVGKGRVGVGKRESENGWCRKTGMLVSENENLGVSKRVSRPTRASISGAHLLLSEARVTTKLSRLRV